MFHRNVSSYHFFFASHKVQYGPMRWLRNKHDFLIVIVGASQCQLALHGVVRVVRLKYLTTYNIVPGAFR